MRELTPEQKERKRERDKQRYIEKREEILEKKKLFRLNNPESVKRSSKKHYEANKEAYIKRAARTRKEKRKEWEAFKSTLKCEHCGEDHPATFDFHHVVRSPDNTKVHKLLSNGNYTKAKEEIKKCIVLCANCHRKHHWQEEQDKKRKRKKKKGAEAP